VDAKLAALQAAVSKHPQDHTAWQDLAIAQMDAGNAAMAILAFQQSLAIRPDRATRSNLALAHLAAGQHETALGQTQALANEEPTYAFAHLTLGQVLQAMRREQEALDALRRAVTIDPTLAQAWLSGGDIYLRNRQFTDGAQWLQTAAASLPRNASLWRLAARLMGEWGHDDAARTCYEESLRHDPYSLRAQLGLAFAIPMVAASVTTLDRSRQHTATLLARIYEQLPQTLAQDRDAPLEWNNFFTAYHGQDDLPLQTSLAKIVSQAVAARVAMPPPSATRSGRLRVGFVSRFFYVSTVGYYFKNWITDLPRDAFETHVFPLYDADDVVAQEIASAADHIHPRKSTLAAQAQTIIDAQIDVLIYPELGMDARTYALAALRLAPRQCMAWGHPVTSALPTIDVAFTSDAMEPTDGQSHWTETLVRLPGLGTRYQHVGLPSDATSKAALGLPERSLLILYPQSLFKIHPDNDAVAVAVLKAVPQSVLIMFQGQTEVMTQHFVGRMTRAFQSAGVNPAGRVKLLPFADHADYLRINQHCDVMLDTLHWSGGNTTLDALVAHLPIVTCPGRYMRGRQSAGMLKLIGCDEGIAATPAELVAKTIGLLTDADARQRYRDKIATTHRRLFDDRQPIDALVEWLRRQ
jgi:protein O-GlcNAc transferase